MFAAHLTSSANGDAISLPDRTIVDAQTSPATARAIYRVDADGNVYEKIGAAAAVLISQWCNPALNAGNYEARATILSGSVNTGTFGSWQALSTSREWGQEVTTNSFVIGQFQVEIRNATTLAVRATATVDAEADRTI